MPKVLVHDVLGRRPTLERLLADHPGYVAEIRAFTAEQWGASPVLFLESQVLGDDAELRLLSDEDTIHLAAIAVAESEESSLALDKASTSAAEDWLAGRRSDVLETIAGGALSPAAAAALEVVEAVAVTLAEMSAFSRGTGTEAAEAPPPAPVPPVAAAPRQWLTLGLLLRVAVTAFSMLPRPGLGRVYFMFFAFVMHLLEFSGLGVMLLARLMSLARGGGGSEGAAEEAQAWEGWFARGCPVPAPGPEKSLVSDAVCILHAFVFSLAPR